MNILKLLGRLGHGAFSGRRAGGNIRTWFTNRNEENERARNHAITHEVKHIPIRNGSRGEGIGMGHRNKKSSTK